MRIAWFSPAQGTSGISEFTRAVLPELARHADPELWCVGRPQPGVAVPVVDLLQDPGATDRLPDYDAVIYNMGNHRLYHREIHQISQLHPGIVVLHDRSMHHFFAGYYITTLRRPDLYRRKMQLLYGERGREVADGVLGGLEERAWRHDDEVVEHAFIEEALRGAAGAVVHSSTHAQAVREHWSGPVCELRLPAYPNQLTRPPSPLSPRTDGRLLLMSTGHVEWIKRIDEVISVLAQHPRLAAQVRYEVVGPYDARSPYVRELHGAIAANGLADTVSLLGYQPADSFERLADAADVFINLRRPNLEGGSASLMGQLPRGRPIVVYDSGTFAEVPSDCVVKCAPGASLARALSELVADRSLRERVGSRARAFAERSGVEPYVQGLLEFCERIGRERPLLELGERAAHDLSELTAGAPVDLAVSRLREGLYDLMPGGISELGTP